MRVSLIENEIMKSNRIIDRICFLDPVSDLNFYFYLFFICRVCNLYNGSLYKSVVILVIDGIGTNTIVKNMNENNWITNKLNLLEVINPAMHASTIFESLFMVPIPDR